MRRAFVLGTKFRRIQNARLLMALKQSFQAPLYSLTTDDATRARIFLYITDTCGLTEAGYMIFCPLKLLQKYDTQLNKSPVSKDLWRLK